MEELRNVNNRIYELRLARVRDDGLALKFFTIKTREMILIAVAQNGLALEFVDMFDQDKEICLTAVKQNGLALVFVIFQDPDICSEATRQNPSASAFVKRVTRISYRPYVPAVDYHSLQRMLHRWSDDGQDYRRDEEQIQIDRSLDDYHTPSKPIPSALRKEITSLLDSRIDSEPKDCEICGEENSTRMGYCLKPCDHDLMCIDCINKLESCICPFCRAEITSVIRI